MIETDEEAVIEKAKRGDSRAFGVLVDRYQGVVFNLALRMVNDREEAKDIAQTVFVKVFQNLGSYDPSHRFFSWIYRIAVNESLNYRGRRRRHEELDPGLESDGRRPDDSAALGEVGTEIGSALMQLNADYRTVVIMRHFLELNQAEMSQILEVPEKTVKSRLHTARRLLGEMLSRKGITS
ncbi:MAG TPA: sigma-70 family RNA polymerase sigma factor [Candidatus Eisenbacteria bacterium]|nr:sigma-70 family RNA polymerase sigma factor [Candidatus Eisenbacteria bacterium]